MNQINSYKALLARMVLMVACDARNSVEELEAKKEELLGTAKAMQEQADAEKRDLTPDEDEKIKQIFAAFEAVDADIERRKKLGNLEERMNASRARQTQPENAERVDVQAGEKPKGRVTGGDLAAQHKGTNGFRNFGDYALAVHAGSRPGGRADPRLQYQSATPSTFSTEGTGADGGYLVPPDFRQSILQKVLGEDALIGRTDQQTTSSNSITFPTDETTPWQTSGGVQAYWEGEGQIVGQSKVGFQATTIRANKLSCLVPVTDELLEDSAAIDAYLRRKVPDKMNYKLNDALLNGDGNGKPLGILNANALVTQAAEGGQTAATVNYSNIIKMWSRMYAPCRSKAVWVINQDIEPQLFSMVVPGGSPALPAYLPPGGLSDKPYGLLLGRPVVYSEASAAVGTVGDISLIDFSQYLTLIKAGGIRSDVSMHLWFDYGITAFHFTMRVGGQPWWSSSIARAKSALPLSFAVALAAR